MPVTALTETVTTVTHMDPGPRTSDGDSDRAPSAAADGRPVRHAVEFELQDLDVTVHGDGLLEVMRPAARSTPADERAE